MVTKIGFLGGKRILLAKQTDTQVVLLTGSTLKIPLKDRLRGALI
jgi:hypothetical protein